MNLDPAALTCGRERVVMLQAGFGAGHRFLATWQAWQASRYARHDPHRCGRLVFIAIEPQPPTHADLLVAHRDSPRPDLARALLAAWPPLTQNLHRLSFDGGRVQLLLLVAEVRAGLGELVARVDTFWLDGTALGPDARICKALGRLAAPGARLTASNAPPEWRAGLTSAGFDVQSPLRDDASNAAANATSNPTSPAALHAHFAPAFSPRHARARSTTPRGSARRALIVGGGLAGCAAAWALAGHGWHSRVLERHALIASEGSGNPAGLFHGIVNAQDGPHARFNRAAALEACRAVQFAVDHHGVAGSARGLLRLESARNLSAMQAMLARLRLPPGYLQAVDAAAASAHGGIALTQPAWFYPGGGWVHPRGLARAFLERAEGHATLRIGVEVHALERSETGWRLLDARGGLIDEAEVVVLANAGDALRLLGDAGPSMQAVRGQISMLATSTRVGAPRLPQLPRMPITGAGYLLPEVNGQALFGATAQPGDADASVRSADHASNLAQLERLTGWRIDVDPQHLEGRTAWRWVSVDRLPVIGAVPDPHGCIDEPGQRARRLDQPRFVPRQPGLFVFTGLGSRGITWCALGAQVLAAAVSGAPAPVEASLLDAVDPARFIVRRTRRRSGT
jgi:tRNA 5-methylaminomethyl-2-thiouridine biosynthesis bifunctional protein